ncbi:MAG: PspA/IM30 family protein, partial [Planctomycetes bacterium]|nr:PspA/IM30 family protein [Planctomycetota bacterium]
MRHFNRLTDIVTCSLTEILSSAADPQAALQEIIHEMEEGVAGANRSVITAQASVERIERELEEHRSQIEQWTAKAKQELSAGSEDAARLALVRKSEVEDLVA